MTISVTLGICGEEIISCELLLGIQQRGAALSVGSQLGWSSCTFSGWFHRPGVGCGGGGIC